jgi:hypothetical protein
MINPDDMKAFEEAVELILKSPSSKFSDLSEITGINLKSDFAYANLQETDLSDVDFSGANLQETDFANSTCIRTNFSRANLYGANLSHADLSDANLSNADLMGADLTSANLEGVILAGANMDGAIVDASVLNSELLSDEQKKAVTTESVEPMEQVGIQLQFLGDRGEIDPLTLHHGSTSPYGEQSTSYLTADDLLAGADNFGSETPPIDSDSSLFRQNPGDQRNA